MQNLNGLPLYHDWKENSSLDYLNLQFPYFKQIFKLHFISDAPEVPLTLHQFPRHQMSEHLSQARVAEQSQGYFSARHYNLSPPHHAPHLPHIYSNHPPSMFVPDLPPPPPTPQEMQDQSYSYQNIQHVGPTSQRTLQRGQRFGDV